VLQPWSTVATVAEDISPASLELLATSTGRSRFPVVQRSTRRVLGFVHVKDILGYEGPSRRAPIPPSVIRPLGVVPPDRTLADLLLAMRRERRHMVLVSDGRSPLGVATLDDVLTAIVGRRRDVPGPTRTVPA
jgi:CBS domain containing-hemolysin-like protein